MGFYDVSNTKNAEGLSTTILGLLEKLKVKSNLICLQTYDGASVMSGERGGVRACVKEQCPRALFIHCYAHQLNLVLLRGSKTIRAVKRFVSELTSFHSFFSRSPKRTEVLREQGFKLPHPSPTRWNYHSRGVTAITGHFALLKAAVHHIKEEPGWDSETIARATDLARSWKSAKFVFLLCAHKCGSSFSLTIFFHFYKPKRLLMCINEIRQTKQNLQVMRRDEQLAEKCKADCLKSCDSISISDENLDSFKVNELLDSITTQLETRFGDFNNLHFVELLNEKSFASDTDQFPNKRFAKLLEQYPFFRSEKSKSELTIVYSDPLKRVKPHQLLKLIVDNALHHVVFEQVLRLLRLFLSIPVTSATSERSMS